MPRHKFQGLLISPRPPELAHLRLEASSHLCGEAAVVGITATPHRTSNARVRQAVGLPHRQVLGHPIAVMDQAGQRGAAAVMDGWM